MSKATSSAVAPAAKGQLVVGNGVNTAGIVAVGSNNQVLTADSATATGVKWAAVSASPASVVNFVATEQSTSSSTYVDLSTVQSVTITTGTKALVNISALIRSNNANNRGVVSFAISGATTRAVSNENSIYYYFDNSDISIRMTAVTLVTGLTAGSNTFTMKFQSNGNFTSNFKDREISVIDMGS
jgi:hypothetical protein